MFALDMYHHSILCVTKVYKGTATLEKKKKYFENEKLNSCGILIVARKILSF